MVVATIATAGINNISFLIGMLSLSLLLAESIALESPKSIATAAATAANAVEDNIANIAGINVVADTVLFSAVYNF